MPEPIFRELFMKFIPSSRPRRAVLVSAVAAASLLSPGTASAAPAAQVQTFASAGTHTFDVPQNVSRIRIVALGGGGGGGGGGGNNYDSLSGGGGAGGGSSAVVSCLIRVRSGSTIFLVVGSGWTPSPGPPGSSGGTPAPPAHVLATTGRGWHPAGSEPPRAPRNGRPCPAGY